MPLLLEMLHPFYTKSQLPGIKQFWFATDLVK